MRFFRRREGWHKWYPEVRKGGVTHNPVVPNVWVCGHVNQSPHLHTSAEEADACRVRQMILAPHDPGPPTFARVEKGER